MVPLADLSSENPLDCYPWLRIGQQRPYTTQRDGGQTARPARIVAFPFRDSESTCHLQRAPATDALT